MSNKRRLLKLFVSPSLKVALCLVCLVAVSFALVIYSGSVVINPVEQLSIGASSTSWNIYVNEVNQTRYMPGGFTEPTLNQSDTSTYAFRVVTDQYKVCAIKVQLSTAMSSSEFSNFNITVLSSTGGSWAQEPLFTAANGSTNKAFINGTVQGDAAYIHQDLSTTKYYLIQVTYSYDLVNATAQIPVTFEFTPLPANSF
ncbi:MAG TPA: hypothetical protein VK536_08740 [Candidatus Limnocylindrales bacterium]|nr:hypothetical protein [Candidatus Limnocylindrales bacterium]